MTKIQTFVLATLMITPVFAADVPLSRTKTLGKAQEPQHLQGIAEAEGTIRAIDETARSVWFVDSSDREYQVRLTKDTQIVNKDNVYLAFSDLKKDVKIHVYYNTHDMSARQIDVIAKGPLTS